ncbi:RNase P/RNase MRP complex subunit [Dispira simplex]|nr:RNase P/RNase MRP complex subunit [Dispira simplex]
MSLYGNLPQHMTQSLGCKPSDIPRDSRTSSFARNFYEMKVVDGNAGGSDNIIKRTLPLTPSYNKELKRKEAKKAERKARQQKKKTSLNSKQRRALRVYELPKDCQKYANFSPLHVLWQEYMRSLVENLAPTQQVQRISSADFHGGIVTIVKSKCPSLVGTQGIVVQETKNLLRIITPDDVFKSIPKINTVFSVEVNNITYQLFGNQLRYTSSERAVRTVRAKISIDL